MLIQPFINYNLPNGWYLSNADPDGKLEGIGEKCVGPFRSAGRWENIPSRNCPQRTNQACYNVPNPRGRTGLATAGFNSGSCFP